MVGQIVVHGGFWPTESGKRMQHLDTQEWSPKAGNARNVGLVSGGFGFLVLQGADGHILIVEEQNGEEEADAGASGSKGAPNPLLLPNGERPSCCSAGYAHAVVGTDQGGLYVWRTRDPFLQLAAFIQPRISITAVAAGEQHSLALAGGVVWSWGSGAAGQLGQGTRIDCIQSPKRLPPFVITPHADGSQTLSPVTVVSIAAGAQHSALITENGQLFTFGWGLYGQCGHDSTDDNLSPRSVSDLHGVPVQEVAAGLWHTACLTRDGAVYTWGGNADGQLGTGKGVGATTPQLVEALPLEEDVIKVGCGARHTVVLTASGGVYSWGWNKYGQLGHPACDKQPLPRVVQGASAVEDVACGWWHTLVLQRDA